MLEPVREWSAYPILDFRITNNISYWGVRGGEAPPLTGGFGEAKPPRKRERGVLPNPVEAHHPLYGPVLLVDPALGTGTGRPVPDGGVESNVPFVARICSQKISMQGISF